MRWLSRALVVVLLGGSPAWGQTASGDRPRPAGPAGTVWVSNQTLNTVAAYDARMGGLLRTVNVGAKPIGWSRSRCEEALGLARRLGERPLEGGALTSLSHLELDLGDAQRALAAARSALRVEEETGRRRRRWCWTARCGPCGTRAARCACATAAACGSSPRCWPTRAASSTSWTWRRRRPAVPPVGDAGAAIDPAARAAYRRRVEELRRVVDDAEAGGDPERAARAREELEFIARELAAVYGLGGAARRLDDPAERARKAVRNRIRDALARIEASQPALGRHLRASIRTGSFCSYQPERPVAWKVRPG
jgi:hypothetical protein